MADIALDLSEENVAIESHVHPPDGSPNDALQHGPMFITEQSDLADDDDDTQDIRAARAGALTSDDIAPVRNEDHALRLRDLLLRRRRVPSELSQVDATYTERE